MERACAAGRSGAWRCRAGRRRLADRGKRHRATLVEILLVDGSGQVRMAYVELLVEVREFAPGILEEEAAAEGEGGAKQIQKKNREENQNRSSVCVVQNRFVRSHELQLVEKPESVAQQDDDREQKCVGDHRGFLGSSEGFPINDLRSWKRVESGAKRRPS